VRRAKRNHKAKGDKNPKDPRGRGERRLLNDYGAIKWEKGERKQHGGLPSKSKKNGEGVHRTGAKGGGGSAREGKSYGKKRGRWGGKEEKVCRSKSADPEEGIPVFSKNPKKTKRRKRDRNGRVENSQDQSRHRGGGIEHLIRRKQEKNEAQERRLERARGGVRNGATQKIRRCPMGWGNEDQEIHLQNKKKKEIAEDRQPKRPKKRG